MIKKVCIITLFFISIYLVGQEKIIKIIDQNTYEPIAGVTIKSLNNEGYISDLNGFVTISKQKTDSLFVSHVAYYPKKIAITDLRLSNYIIFLEEKLNVLDEVIISNTNLSLDSIIAKTKRNMILLHSKQEPIQKFYSNTLELMDVQNLQIDFDSKNTASNFDENKISNQIKSFENQLKNNNSGFTKHFKGLIKRKEIFVKDIKKYLSAFLIDSFTGTKENDTYKIIDFDDLQNKAQKIILNALNSKNTYKVKSGLFKIEDSLSTKSFSENKSANTFSYNDMQIGLRSAFDSSNFYQQDNEINFFDRKYYDLQLINSDKEFYTLSFTPKKAKSKYQGKMKIDKYSLTIHNLKYEFAEGKKGQSLNLKLLLGVKFSEDLHQVELTYQTIGNTCYVTNFKETKKSYFYVNRPIKFIENSKQKMKLLFNFKTEINKKDFTEVLLSKPLDIKLPKIEKIDYKKEYNYVTKDALNTVKW